MRTTRALLLPFALVGTLSFSACSDEARSSSSGADAGNHDSSTPADPGRGGFLVTVSGEDLAGLGYDFTTNSLSQSDPPSFVDGWEVRFHHVIVTIDNIRLNADPDKDSANPETMGAVVAQANGPWAVDLSLGGTIPGKSGSPDEKTIAIASFATQASGAAFGLTERYAFSYDTALASATAQTVNLDGDGLALYEQAKQHGWAMIYNGTATYRGLAPTADSVFAKIPTIVNFTLGLANPASYINCENTDLAKIGEGYPRGIQPNATKAVTAQITIHTDHAFWSRLNVEGTELHFDGIAAQASSYGTPEIAGAVTMDDLVNVDITGFKTKAGEPLPWRNLVSDYTAPAGQMRFDPNGTSFAKVNSFASYLAYSAASGGHLNADGECKVKNRFTP